MARGGKRPGAGRKRKADAAAASTAARAKSIEYSDEIAAKICELVAMGGMLKAICAQRGMPDRVTVWRWRQDRPDFDRLYRAACEAKAEAWEDELRQIADDGRNDTQTDEDGNKKVDHDHIRRSELRVNTLKWLMERHNRTTYGDRKTVDLNTNDSLAEELEEARQRFIAADQVRDDARKSR